MSHKKKTALLLGVLPLALMASQVTAAEVKSESAASKVISDSSLNLKLVNEYRNADKPSAKPPFGPEIDAWTQGFMFDFKSGKVADVVGVESNLYRIQ